MSSIYDWRLRTEESIYYGSPLVMYAYLYMCEEKKREREREREMVEGQSIIIYMASPLAGVLP